MRSLLDPADAPRATTGLRPGEGFRMVCSGGSSTEPMTKYKSSEIATWPGSNDPIPELVIPGTVDGERKVVRARKYSKAFMPSSLLQGILDALAAAGVKEPEEGGVLDVRLDKTTREGQNDRNWWTVRYTPADQTPPDFDSRLAGGERPAKVTTPAAPAADGDFD